MHGQPQRHYSVDDYFAIEATSSIRHEYCDGEIFAMAGASVAHNDITANIVSTLRIALRNAGCKAFSSDLRLRAPGGLYTYPDVLVICGQIQLAADRPDTVTNPVLLVEVLSEATRDYDRGEKFTLYKTIATLREYLLVEQDRAAIEHFRLDDGGEWASTSHSSLTAVVPLVSVPAALSLSEVYRDVFGSRLEAC